VSAYRHTSIEGQFLAGEPEAVGTVNRWISLVLTSSRFWSLRCQWLDLHQEVMKRAVESLRYERFDDAQDFRTYVQAVARYTALQAINSSVRTGALDIVGARSRDRSGAGTEAIVVYRQLARQVLAQASEDCRRLFKAYFYEQRSYEEIARDLEMPVGTVKSRLFRCLQKAQRLLDRPKRQSQASPEV